MMRLAAPLAFAFVALGCGPTTEPPSDAGVPDADSDAPIDGGPVDCKHMNLAFVGDASKDLVVDVVVLDETQTKSVPVTDGSVVAIVQPPQGGRVIFVGLRATNLDPCNITLTGALRDPATKQVRLDKRTINLIPGGDGWAMSDPTDISTYSNVPVCPNQWASTDVYDQPFEMVIALEDKHGRKATKTLPVTPKCNEPGASLVAECLCICKAGYVLGDPCPGADAGP